LLEDAAYRADVEVLLEVCDEGHVAVQTIKAVARRRWEGDPHPRFSWYEPLSPGPALGRAVRHVLGNPQLFLNTSSDARLLRPILEAATAGGSAPSGTELRADVQAEGMRPLFDGATLERI
jgi:hypothetical protein